MGKFKKDQNVNVVEVRGRIVGERVKGSKTFFTVCSNAGGKNGKSVFTHFETKAALPEHKSRAMLTVKGHLESKKAKRGNEIILTQVYVADDVELADTITDEYFGVKGKFFEKHSATAFLNGIVVSIKDDGEWIRYILNVGNVGSHENTVLMTAKKQERPIVVRVGYRVCAVCKITSTTMMIDRKEIPLNSLVVNDMAVISA